MCCGGLGCGRLGCGRLGCGRLGRGRLGCGRMECGWLGVALWAGAWCVGLGRGVVGAEVWCGGLGCGVVVCGAAVWVVARQTGIWRGAGTQCHGQAHGAVSWGVAWLARVRWVGARLA